MPNDEKAWYNDTQQASYSVSPAAGTLWTSKFNRWEGDITTGPTTNAAGSLLMKGPKKISAKYELEFTYIAVIVAGLAAIPIGLEVVLKEHRIRRFFIRIYGYTFKHAIELFRGSKQKEEKKKDRLPPKAWALVLLLFPANNDEDDKRHQQ